MAQRGEIFRSVGGRKPKRTAFDLSFDNKLSTDFGVLTPVLCKEVVPGDTFKITSEMMVRMAPTLAPVMHNINVTVHFFFVPDRIIWEDFEDFITGGADGLSSPVVPYVESVDLATYAGSGTLADCLGIPNNIGDGQTQIVTLPFRAYQKIYNEYYRDQNLTDEVELEVASGEETTEFEQLFKLRKRCWQKDYFTSALPFAQRGGDVSLPLSLGGSASVSGAAGVYYYDAQDGTVLGTSLVDLKSGDSEGNVGVDLYNAPGSSQSVGAMVELIPSGPSKPDGSKWLHADMSEATVNSPTIRDLRRASKLQEWLERNARGGSRYIEQILSHFGVRSSDARLQRPEYLGGGSVPVVISEVLQQAASTDADPAGAMAGHGIAVGNSPRFKKFFEEHGYIMGIMSIMPTTAYMDGLPRHFLKQDKFDYYFPEFAHIGEQPIFNAEISAAHRDPYATFGYTPRYAEYKYSPSECHGDFRGNLSFWHLARPVSDDVALNTSFVECDKSSLNRIFAVDDSDPDSPYYESVNKFWIEIYHHIVAKRPMPLLGDPQF